VSPNGTEANPTVINDDTTIALSWNTVLFLTDEYEVEVYDSGNVLDWSNYGISGSGTSTVTTGVLALGDIYHWHVRAVNITCNSFDGTDDNGPWSDWGYFRLNQAVETICVKLSL